MTPQHPFLYEDGNRLRWEDAAMCRLTAVKQGPGSIILYDAAVKKPGDDIDIESLRFRLVAYSRRAPHGRGALLPNL